MNWREVPGINCQVSDEGEVKTLEGVYLTQSVSAGNPYPRVRVDGQYYKVHHLVALAFHGPRPKRMLARHLDDVPTNNRADNIAWGTYRDNLEDAYRNRGKELRR